MKDPDSLLANYENLDHRLVPERVEASADVDFPIQNQVENLEDRYEIIREIARGGHKQICEAHDHLTDRRVALATLHGAATAAESEAFLREARLHASLLHPSILRVYDLGILPDNRAFFTMTLMTGRTLGDLIREKTPLPKLLEVFLRLCDGIAYAHSRKVLHLDLKPENVQVGRFGDVFVADWGLASIGAQDADSGSPAEDQPLDADMLNHFTLSGTIKGTPGYMAPEQASGGDTSVATDVYGLGAILYAILCGVTVGDAPTAEEVLEKTRTGAIQPPIQRTPNRAVPLALNAVCMRALATKPEDRYPDVDTLRNEIRRYRDGFATDAEQAGFFDHLRLLVKRHKTLTALATVFLLILFITTALFIRSVSRSEQAAIAARDQALELKHQAEEAELAALAARDEAMAANAATAASLKALQKARRQKAQLSQMFSTWLLEDSQKIYDDQIISKGTQVQFAKVKEKVEAAYAQFPNDPEVLLQKGFIDFIFQDFQSAASALRATRDPEITDLLPVVDELAAAQAASSASTKALTVRAIQKLPPERQELARYLFLNAAATKEFENRPAYVRATLVRENPGLPASALRIIKPELRKTIVDLSGAKALRTIEFETPPHDHLILYRLNAVEINLCDTNVTAIKSLVHNARLRRLKIAGAPVKDLQTIARLANLEYVLIDAQQHQAIERYNLRTNLVVEVRTDPPRK